MGKALKKVIPKSKIDQHLVIYWCWYFCYQNHFIPSQTKRPDLLSGTRQAVTARLSTVKSCFVVIDPTKIGSALVVAKDLCLTIFNLPLTQNACLLTFANKASVCVCVHIFYCFEKAMITYTSEWYISLQWGCATKTDTLGHCLLLHMRCKQQWTLLAKLLWFPVTHEISFKCRK